MNDKTKLIKEIETAFADVPYPGDQNITTHRCWECDQLTNLFKGHHWNDWRQKPRAIFNQCHYGFIHTFSPKAYQFYLPLFLLTPLEHDEDSGFVIDTVISSLTNPSYAEPPEEIMKKHKFEGILGMTPEKLEQLKEMQKMLSIPRSAQEKKEDIARYREKRRIFTQKQILIIESFLKFLKKEHEDDFIMRPQIESAIKSISEWKETGKRDQV